MAKRENQNDISPIVSRIADTAVEIMGTPDAKELAFLHTVLAQCSLPYREPEAGARDYIRENGRSSLIVTAGHMLDPKTGKPKLQGIPYGAKPRLLMIHLCTEAVRTKSQHITIADSMSAFMKDLGLSISGGKHGSIGRFKEQLNRLAASRMQMILRMGDYASIMNPAPIIQQFDVWFPGDPRQKILWPSEVVLSNEFFETLKAHALPLDTRSIRALQHSARAIDIYTWLAHRLPRVKKQSGERVSWAALQGQFGPDISDIKNFKRHIIAALKQAMAVYPAAKVEQVTGGLMLKKSAPPIQKKIVYR